MPLEHSRQNNNNSFTTKRQTQKGSSRSSCYPLGSELKNKIIRCSWPCSDSRVCEMFRYTYYTIESETKMDGHEWYFSHFCQYETVMHINNLYSVSRDNSKTFLIFSSSSVAGCHSFSTSIVHQTLCPSNLFFIVSQVSTQ